MPEQIFEQIHKWRRPWSGCQLFLELYEEGEVEYINGVWPVLSNEQLIHSTKNLTLRAKPTIEPPALAFN